MSIHRTVMINADDFGLCEGVNRGVLRAHREGILTSATLMTTMPAAKEAVQIAKDCPTLGVGIHLNLTEGKPLTAADNIPLLVDAEGYFKHSPASLSLLSLTHSDARKAIYTELLAQVLWAIDHGITPTHLDSHKHIHCFPTLYAITCRVAKQLNIRAIRCPFEPRAIAFPPFPAVDFSCRKRARTLRLLTGINRLQAPAFLRNQTLLGVAHTGNINYAFLQAAWQYNSLGTVEIMTHPGYLQGLDKTKTRLYEQREGELEALCDKRIVKLFKSQEIQLIHYGQLAN